ncbi:MAG: M43 family zinc metalloprotease [Bacteroidetes bacterium]|nr:M43 family zinc metalloprotease [Bacteroidota bacterium]
MSLSFLGTAQNVRRCSSAEYAKALELSDPAYLQRRIESESESAQWIAAHTGESQRSIVTIPVVFHMLYHDTSQYLDDTVIQSQLDVINEDYRRTNPDSGQTPLAFRAVAADCEIEFCFAKRTPSGQLTTGIIHKYTNDTAFSNYDETKLSSSGGDDAWDATRYLNIWVAAFTNQNFLGLGTFPGGDLQYDGVVINYKACGRIGSHLLTHYNKGRSLTHEIGHWLNLLHVWGDDGNTCNADDNVSDTPLQSAENYGCPSYPKTDNCTSSFPGIMFMNYLDYTDDECMNAFTEGQKTRMLAALNIDRASILASNGCVPVGIEENELKDFISVFPNPSADKFEIRCNFPGEINGEILMMNMLGETLINVQPQTSALPDSKSVDISTLSNGIYFLEINTQAGKAVYKIMKSDSR